MMKYCNSYTLNLKVFLSGRDLKSPIKVSPTGGDLHVALKVSPTGGDLEGAWAICQY
ncbi:hypothetical protein BDD43_3980 [Mucilaginibacter gracilis]|uniref:Uncharacterized protein n=1 Tax=Mucilaginibacter gracilis TaxID=423350 RepID=A0A495J458_9SPHI|nr:hypothetical protein BDD43_3980 [Mucilaginibacter gracilis]